MQIVIQVKDLAHLTDKQMGAFVAHCFTLNDFSWIKVNKADDSVQGTQPSVEIAFSLPNWAQLVDSEKLQAQLEDAAKVFGDMEPFPCPCGCGAFISVSPCYRQSGELVDEIRLNAEEKALADRGDKIAAIRALRLRINKANNVPLTSGGFYEGGHPGFLGLKDAKDLVDAYMMQAPRHK